MCPLCINAHAQEPVGLSLQEALKRTYLDNPQLRAARSELMAVQERLPQAYAGWRPSITGETSITVADVEGSNFGGGDGSTAKDFLLSARQPLFRGGRTFSEVSAARHAIKAQVALVLSQEQDILLNAAIAYMDVIRDQALLGLARNNRDVIAKQLEASEIRFEVGELTRTDVSQAKARLAGAEAEVIRSRGALRSSRAAFEEITGLSAQNLSPSDLQLPIPPTKENALQTAEENNPMIVTALHIHKAASKDSSSIMRELLPEIAIQGQWNRTYDPVPGLIDEQTSQSVGVVASMPLYLGGETRSRARQAKHTANQRYLDILKQKRSVRQNVITAWEELSTSRSEIESRRAQITAASVAREGVHKEMQFGTRTVLDGLDADQELLDAQVAFVIAKRDEIVAVFTLMSQLGLLTPDRLGFGDQAFDYEKKLNSIVWNFLGMHVDSVED